LIFVARRKPSRNGNFKMDSSFRWNDEVATFAAVMKWRLSLQ
jgi:hypothetical protein